MTIQRVELGLAGTSADAAGCACCAAPETSVDEQMPASAAVTTTLQVDGMTCAHCVASVTEELSAVPGVEAVSVALAAGATSTVTISGPVSPDPEALRAAVAEAGYSVSGISA